MIILMKILGVIIAFTFIYFAIPFVYNIYLKIRVAYLKKQVAILKKEYKEQHGYEYEGEYDGNDNDDDEDEESYLNKLNKKNKDFLTSFNGPENTIYLNVNDMSDMKCPYQLMSIKEKETKHLEKYGHFRLDDDFILISYQDRDHFNNLFDEKERENLKDNLKSNNKYRFIIEGSDFLEPYKLKENDVLYQRIVKDNNLDGYTYYEVIKYLKKKNDLLRLSYNQALDFEHQYNTAKHEYKKNVDLNIDQALTNQKIDKSTQLQKELNDILNKK